ncbi:LLM class flavin-dependent oxidoreductase [Streptomyces sp. SudanB182_2057]|uniref:LLM class flavin-dependent oxidoreductase n=1 Tax=Streptomyces sp. SudanB182_2057 TaxID=3035281 RepID=UPI003F543977
MSDPGARLKVGIQVPPCDRADRIVAPSGPRNLRLAGEAADGVILFSGDSPRTLASATAGVREGADAAGRAARTVPLTVSAYCEVTDDIVVAARRIKPICTAIARNGGTPFLAPRGDPRRRVRCPPMSSTASIRTWRTPRTGTPP